MLRTFDPILITLRWNVMAVPPSDIWRWKGYNSADAKLISTTEARQFPDRKTFSVLVFTLGRHRVRP